MLAGNREALRYLTEPAVVAAARSWIDDCEWGDLSDTIELDDADVLLGVARHYDGGMPQFIADGGVRCVCASSDDGECRACALSSGPCECEGCAA